MNTIRNILLIVVALSVSGCAAFSKRDDRLTDRNSEIVATDFVTALSSLRGHQPKNTMLQIRPTKTGFGNSLKRELRNAGYGIQSIANNDTGPTLVTYQADSFENTTFESVAYRVRVGSVELGREYEIRAGNVFPVTSLSVKGVGISTNPLDESIFERASGRDSFDEQDGWQPIGPGYQSEPESPVIVTPIERPVTIVQTIPDRSIETRSETLSNPTSPEAYQRPRQLENMLMLGESNYADIYKRYNVVKSEVVVFPNDSMRLGDAGKEKVAKFLSGFKSDSDILSVVGCSHGKTNVIDGNRKLALGRAQRIIDELLVHRILASKIFDEGCWAGVSQKELPGRGVILTMRRKAGPA